MKNNIIGIILAGGESRRFGSPKAFATYQNRYFYEFSRKALEKRVNEVYVVSHPSIKERFKEDLTITVVEDQPEFRGNGPLAGILTVMKISKADWYVVLPCDAPNVTSQLVEQLLKYVNEADVDAIVPEINGRRQPLLAIYHSRVGEKIENLLKKKMFKMSDLLESCRVKFVTNQDLNIMGDEFDNINHRSEYEKLKDGPM